MSLIALPVLMAVVHATAPSATHYVLAGLSWAVGVLASWGLLYAGFRAGEPPSGGRQAT